MAVLYSLTGIWCRAFGHHWRLAARVFEGTEHQPLERYIYVCRVCHARRESALPNAHRLPRAA